MKKLNFLCSGFRVRAIPRVLLLGLVLCAISGTALGAAPSGATIFDSRRMQMEATANSTPVVLVAANKGSGWWGAITGGAKYAFNKADESITNAFTTARNAVSGLWTDLTKAGAAVVEKVKATSKIIALVAACAESIRLNPAASLQALASIEELLAISVAAGFDKDRNWLQTLIHAADGLNTKRLAADSFREYPPCDDKEYSRLAAAAYLTPASDGYCYLVQTNGSKVTTNKYEAVEPPKTSDTGFSATLFRDVDGKLVLSFKGTDMTSWQDWANNAANAFGLAPQYAEAVEFAMAVKKEYPNEVVTFVGHSLGGGLAQYAALATGSPAVTFNAADPGLAASLPFKLFGPQPPHISNYRYSNDPLSALDEFTHFNLMTEKFGTDYYIHGNVGGFDAHGLDPLINELEKECPDGFEAWVGSTSVTNNVATNVAAGVYQPLNQKPYESPVSFKWPKAIKW